MKVITKFIILPILLMALFTPLYKNIFGSAIIGMGGSVGSTVDVDEDEDTTETDVYGNPIGYKYYDYSNEYYNSLPKEYNYQESDKNNNPDKYVTINFKAPNLSTAVYNIGGQNGVITCDGITYNLFNRDSLYGVYEKVVINNIEYKLNEGLIDARYTGEYLYEGKLYEVDYAGNLCAFKHKWVETVDGNQVYGDWEQTDEYLFKYEIPFNTLWKNRPLTDEEKELLNSGPGVGLKSFSVGANSNNTVNVIINKNNSSNLRNTKKKTIDDPLNPMKAQSTKKKKD